MRHGRPELGRREIQRAIRVLEEYSRKYPRDPEAHFWIGEWTFYGLADRLHGLQRVRRSLDLDPGNAYFRFNYAILLYYAGRTEGMVEQMQEVLRRDPSILQAHRWLALGLHRLGRIGEALYHRRLGETVKPGSELVFEDPPPAHALPT